MSGKKIPLLDLLCLAYPDMLKKELYAKVLCGEVYVNNEKIRDARRLVDVSSHIDFRIKEYVSRGGIKLAHVLDKWKVDVKDKVFIDAGCSSGGFTDCLLKHGARFVHAIDVGYNQLAYSLRIDKRVCVHERTNTLDIRKSSLDPAPHMGVCDLSFRSLHGAASHLLGLLSEDILIALVKPQFEWDNPEPGFRGVIKNRDTILMVCTKLVEELHSEGVTVSSAELSPVCGAKGNQEIFFLLKKQEEEQKQDIISLIAGFLFNGNK
ncbi:MAG: TlyA family rRNA (cytidine-2'-O)-methyltransferase [Spirochaetales bacterium]|nr:TlyA family rRNA (cytidine-2'-O)-methyltransferase [Spirochaetales bacterium]